MNQLPGRLPDQVTAGQRYFAPAPHHGPVELYDEHDPIVHVPHPYDPHTFVQVRRSQLQLPAPPPPRDLRPVPVIDPQAQVIFAKGAATGMAGAGVGWGISEVVGATAGASGGTLIWIILLALVLRARGGRTINNIHNESHTYVQQKWFGQTDVTTYQ